LKGKKYDVKYLLSVISKNFDSFMFHKPYLKLLERQAEMLDIDLFVMESEGVEKKEVKDLKELIESVKDSVNVVVAGGIRSNHHGRRIKKICNELRL